MKYECKLCGAECVIESKKEPQYCPSRINHNSRWQPVSETQPKPLGVVIKTGKVDAFEGFKVPAVVYTSGLPYQDMIYATINHKCDLSKYGCNEARCSGCICNSCVPKCTKKRFEQHLFCVAESAKNATQDDLSCKGATLPKLTVAVFDREDCPKWANYAAVNMDRTAFFFGNVPNRGCSNPRRNYWSYHHSEMMQIPGQFDPSGWQNSLIERPAKEISKEDVEKFVKNNLNQGYLLVDGELKPIENKLPDWVKVGAWVFKDEFGIIVELGKDDATAKVKFSWGKYGLWVPISKLKPAHIRDWTDEELKQQVGKTFRAKATGSLFLAVGYLEKEKELLFSDGESSAQEMLEKSECIDGSPCGVLEVEEVGK